MKITSIEQFKGKTLKVSFESGEPIFINSDIAAEYHIQKDMDIPQGGIDDIVRANDARRAKERALYLLDNRDYSYAELFKKLAENYDEDICYEVLNRLAEIGCIDDRRYAKYLAEKLCTVKKYGYFKAREEMRLKGLSRDIIEEALADYSSDSSERIMELIDKKYARYLTDEKGVKKVKAALARLGYSFADINAAISEYTSGESSEFDDFDEFNEGDF